MEQSSMEIIVDAFASLLEAETGQGIDDWSREEMEKVSAALEHIGRSYAAKRLRKGWNLHAKAAKS